ncbi:MAG: hypothetical protein M3342_25325 [Bacteroidota bacterium]|nr:hypothetical protein [Bacteroidota bacterium]
MARKKSILLALFACITMASFGQTMQEKIDKAAKDPKTEENAAKADVYLHRHDIGAERLKKTNDAQKVPAASKKKKKPCRKASK